MLINLLSIANNNVRESNMRIEAIRQVAVAAPDLAASIDFYSNILGLSLIAQFDPPGLAFFDAGGVRVLLERNAAPATIYYHVKNLDAACDELRAHGIGIVQEPHMIFKDDTGTFGPAGEEEWMAFVKDPADNIVGLASRR